MLDPFETIAVLIVPLEASELIRLPVQLVVVIVVQIFDGDIEAVFPFETVTVIVIVECVC